MTQRFTLDALVRRRLAALTPVRAEALAALLAFALAAGFAATSAYAAEPAPAAAGATAGAPAATAATQMTVKPGQSLNDIAVAVTQSHDKTVLGRAARAIFDANPAAFMRGDPSLMKLGAVLNVPPLDATGAVVKAPAQPAVAAPASAGAPSGASKPAANTVPGGQALAPAGNANVKPVPAVPSAASASAAPASATPSVPAAPRVQSPTTPAPAVQPNAASQTGSAGGHAWTGAIQPAPAPAVPQPSPVSAASAAAASGVASAPGAVGASVPAATAVPAASGVSAASGAAEAPGASSVKPAQPAMPVQGGIPASAAAVSGTAPASAAGASAAHVSSLQQLLTLKNRVLKEWQQHGFSSSAQRQGGVSGANNGAAAGGQGGAAAGGAARQGGAADQQFVGFGGLGLTLSRATIAIAGAVAAAIMAVLVVLLGALLLGRRKRRAVAAAAADIDAMPTKGEASAQGSLTGLPPADAAQDPLEAEYLAALARTPTSKRALMGLAGHYAERRNVTGFDEIAQRIWHLTGGRGPNWDHVAVLGRQLDPDNPLFAGAPDQAGDAVTSIGSAAQAAVQAETGDARPSEPAVPVADQREDRAHNAVEVLAAKADAAPSAAAPAARADATEPELAPTKAAEVGEPISPAEDEAAASKFEQETVPEPAAAANVEPEGLPADTHDTVAPDAAHAEPVAPQPAPAVEPPVEPHALTDEAGPDAAEAIAPEAEPAARGEQADAHALEPAAEHVAEPLPKHEAEPAAVHHDEAAAAQPTHEPDQQLPADAVAALENLDMGLPPRAEPAHEVLVPTADDAEPAAHHPHAQESQHDELDEDEDAAARPVGETIEHGVAGPAAVAGLGAAPFGALNLSFDLDLPAGAGEPAQASPVPTFTPEQLAKIARNKLELASEYIALGDLGGARTLLHEVIESNDADTRDEAHALLATLAPLS